MFRYYMYNYFLRLCLKYMFLKIKKIYIYFLYTRRKNKSMSNEQKIIESCRVCDSREISFPM